MQLKVSTIQVFGKHETIACDGKCEKAWGISSRPKVELDQNDPDDCYYLADGELGDAPSDPGTYEGGHGKPNHPVVHNKWCYRQCERRFTVHRGEVPTPKDFSKRVYNQPFKHPELNEKTV